MLRVKMNHNDEGGAGSSRKFAEKVLQSLDTACGSADSDDDRGFVRSLVQLCFHLRHYGVPLKDNASLAQIRLQF